MIFQQYVTPENARKWPHSWAGIFVLYTLLALIKTPSFLNELTIPGQWSAHFFFFWYISVFVQLFMLAHLVLRWRLLKFFALLNRHWFWVQFSFALRYNIHWMLIHWSQNGVQQVHLTRSNLNQEVEALEL